MKNTGLIIEPVQPEDFVFGADRSLATKFQGEPLQPNAYWGIYLPEEEKQAPGYETSACVSFGTASAIEILANRIFHDRNNLSDRFVAKGSGTDQRAGNTPKKVADFIYRNWSVLEREWATKDAGSVEEFYADIPENLKTLAVARGAEYAFGYEYVGTSKAQLREALKYSPLGISVPAWHEKDKRYYRPKNQADNHWTVCYGITDEGELFIFDTYAPHLKVMHKDFTPSVAMRYHLAKQTVSDTLFNRFIRLIKTLLGV